MTSNTGLLIDTFAISRWYNKPHIAEAAVVEHKLAYFFDDWSCCLPAGSCLSSTNDMVLVNKTWRLKVIEVLDYWCRISSAGQKHAAFRWFRSGSSTNLHIAYRNVCVTRQSLELNPRFHWLLLWVPSPSFEWLTYVEMTEGEGDFVITGYNKHLL